MQFNDQVIRVLVVDDEPPSRQRVVRLLMKSPVRTEITEAESGPEALDALRNENFDLMFLDVQMPEMNGLEVLRQTIPEWMPTTIFVTAYEEHALDAFEAGALDYLLKPFSDERFRITLERARRRIEERGARQLIALPVEASRTAPYLDRLAFKGTRGIEFIPVSKIESIEGAGVYVTVHTESQERLYRSSLANLEERLDNRCFLRVHRSAIINFDALVRLEPRTHGEFEALMRNGRRVRVSRNYRMALEQRLGQKL